MHGQEIVPKNKHKRGVLKCGKEDIQTMRITTIKLMEKFSKYDCLYFIHARSSKIILWNKQNRRTNNSSTLIGKYSI